MLAKGEYPNVGKLILQIKEAENFSERKWTMLRSFKDIVFKYQKINSGRKLFMKSSDIIAVRTVFLRIMEIRQAGTRYLDET